MKVYQKDIKIMIELNGKCVCINEEKYELAAFDYTKGRFFCLVKYLRQFAVENYNLTVEDYNAEDEEIILLLALTSLHNTFFYMDNSYELSFAYAVPLYRDEYLLEFSIEHLYECLKTQNIVFLQSESLYLCEKVRLNGYERVSRSNKKTIIKNSNIIIEQVPFSNKFFDFWREYDFVRFGEKQTKEFKEFFEMVYNSNSAFKLYEYRQNEKTVAYNVCYYSQTQEVIYDVLFPWKNIDSTYRIGIYSIIVNLKKAVEMGWGYSICYGIFDYKDNLWNKL